jgi:hypothetical protein
VIARGEIFTSAIDRGADRERYSLKSAEKAMSLRYIRSHAGKQFSFCDFTAPKKMDA